MKDEIILYQAEENSVHIEVRVEGETIWLTQSQIAELFNSSKANVSEHIKNIFITGELKEDVTVRKIRTVQVEGNRRVNRLITHYNLDLVISIGYRVNSIRGTQFRIWANRILKNYLLQGYSINQRTDRLELELQELNHRVNQFELELKTSLPPKEGIFFDGQVFDAYLLVNKIIRSALQSIVLVDNYVDETVLSILLKRNDGVTATIYTSNLTKELILDVQKHNEQYQPIQIVKFTKSHDRFLILDSKLVYHIGASLKDVGKKWFAFSKIELDPNEIINRIQISLTNSVQSTDPSIEESSPFVKEES